MVLFNRKRKGTKTKFTVRCTNMEFTSTDKPDDCPINNNEAKLETIINLINKFYENPSFEIKEVILSMCTVTSLNQHNGIGRVRTNIDSYEISILNSIYLFGSMNTFPSVKFFVYDYIYRTVRTRMTTYQMINGSNSKEMKALYENFDLNDYKGLLPQLLIVVESTIELKERNFDSFNSSFIGVSKMMIENTNIEELKKNIAHAVLVLVSDLSNASGLAYLDISWDRETIYKTFQFVSDCLDIRGENPTERPLLGLMCLSISKWILGSRNYHCGKTVYKAISRDVLKSAVPKNEIWMRDVKDLNDKYEGEVVKEIFEDKDWIKPLWAKNIILKKKSKTYVSSFTKVKPNGKLKRKYGDSTLGYTTDIIGESIAPLVKDPNHGYYRVAQYSFYDVIYSQEQFKNEMEYLFSIIDIFNITSEQKTTLLNEVIPYWYLTIKNPDWKSENERRYEIYIRDYEMLTATEEREKIDEQNVTFLKCKTPLFAYPDFLNTEDKELQQTLLIRSDERLNYLYKTKEYYRCNECLSQNFDVIKIEKNIKCNVCGSENIFANSTKK